MKEKVNLQNIILRYISDKKTASHDDVIKYVALAVDSGISKRKVKSEYVIQRTLKHLIKEGYVIKFETNRSEFFRITKEGRQKLRSFRLDNPHPIPMGWDGKWRIIILDVNESEKEMRSALRYILKKANFVCLKNSVWISPHPFEHLLTNMKEDLGLTSELMIIVTDNLDSLTEKYLRDTFLL
ncbi:hypothetical protein A2997_00375 [Candidatus Nomurabacteria bacterium RIFCSPLOWO2_01_FULL_36_10b]|uniref:Transcriptional repressor PaaX-like central Cas2-like domain-containing protein n=1 Tax=Candidatus Nomurabacteria bacterium RIFCSPLOWO2_01_FULL_36_10b TaxID=1801766 RepID=A0A1F6WNZ1_9BACT|nr:MAG: hypothetical protein A2997_00375 [Candidatus Nomurabacteria bacterium RIFCSPLOWO2_01_FULL_36_10b]